MNKTPIRGTNVALQSPLNNLNLVNGFVDFSGEPRMTGSDSRDMDLSSGEDDAVSERQIRKPQLGTSVKGNTSQGNTEN